jgi:nicotinamide-nucleotide amidase
MARAVEVLSRARDNNDLVITTGGLGPTEDDLTREAIAATMGEDIYVDPALENALRERYARQGRDLLERARKQAWLIPSARPITNARGTAPGWWVERDGKIIVSMPGPPGEMTRMWEEEVTPELLRRQPGSVLVKRTIKTSGLGEPLVEEAIASLLHSDNPSIGIYARPDGVQVRIAAKAPTQEEAQRLIAPLEVEVRNLLGPIVWGTDDDTFTSIVAQMMIDRGLTLAVMESCTGGLLSDEITNVPGSSRYFRGGIVSYATEVKEMMGVDPAIISEHGVVSAQTAAAMALAVRLRLKADIGIGITGVAGPDPQDGVPVGQVYIGLDGDDAVAPQSMGFLYQQGREQIKRRAVTQAITLLRRALLGG